MAEAGDLGAALVRAHSRSLWFTFLPLYAVSVTLALCTVGVNPYLPCALIFGLKPWFDCCLLFCLSRAVFGQPTRSLDLAQHLKVTRFRHLLAGLTWRRFSPWRAYLLPIDQLEDQRGKGRRMRRKQFLRGRRGAAFAMHVVYGYVESLLCIAVFSMAFWFVPGAELRDLWPWLRGAGSTGDAVLVTLGYAVVVGALEPFFVASGFAMYMNRRVELEAWDIEQDFRHAFP
jgi:hypothetical protein